MTVIINGSTGIDTVQDGIVTDAKLNLTANSQEIKDAINASGTAPIYAARAWVNFNGTGTVAIRGSGNVSSITDNGVGNYTVNFTTAMPDVNFSAQLSTKYNGIDNGGYLDIASTSSGSVQARVFNASLAVMDSDYVSVSVFR